MKQLTVTIFVAPATAALAGRSSVGEISLALSDADLGQLSEAQRGTLAEYLRSGESCLRQCDVAEATVATLALLLDARAAAIASRAAELAAREAAEEAAAEAELAALAGCPIESLFSVNRWGVLAPQFPRSARASFVELLGRQEEGEKFLRETAQNEKDRTAAKLAVMAAASAAADAKIASDRAELRAFLAPHFDVVGMAWFDALENPEVAKAEVRRIVVAALGAGSPGWLRDLRDWLLPAGARVGHSINPITDLAVYRRVGQLVVAVGEALGGDLYKGASAEVENVTLWRDAEDGEDGDGDGEVAEYEWIRIRCEVGGVAVSLYTR